MMGHFSAIAALLVGSTMAASSTLSSPSLTSSLRTMHLSAESARHTPVLRMRGGGAKKQAPVMLFVLLQALCHAIGLPLSTALLLTLVV